MVSSLESIEQTKQLNKLKKIPNSHWVKTILCNKSGTPDIVGHIRGHIIYIEVKRDEKSKPSTLQEYTINKLNKQGALAFVSCDWGKTRDILQQFADSKGFSLFG